MARTEPAPPTHALATPIDPISRPAHLARWRHLINAKLLANGADIQACDVAFVIAPELVAGSRATMGEPTRQNYFRLILSSG